MPTSEERAERRHIEVMTGLLLIAARLERIAEGIRDMEPPDSGDITEKELAAVLKEFEPLKERVQELW